MVVFGTSPETIKCVPWFKNLNHGTLETVVCVTGQHKERLKQVLEALNVVPDYNHSIMKEKQTLLDVTINILEKMKSIFEEVKPDVVLVHGGTTTTFVTSLIKSGTCEKN